MEPYGKLQVSDAGIEQALIESNCLLVKLDEKSFVHPVQNHEVQKGNGVEHWQTSREHECHQ